MCMCVYIELAFIEVLYKSVDPTNYIRCIFLIHSSDLIGAVIAAYLFAVCYEGLKTLREWLLYYDIKQFKQETSSGSSIKTKGKDRDTMTLVEDKFKKPKRYSTSHRQ